MNKTLSMERRDPVTVVHMTSVHPLTDIRIHKKECRTLAAAGYKVVLVGPGESRDASSPSEPQVIGVKRPKDRIERFALTTWRVFRTALRVNGAIYHAHDPELLPVLLALRALGKIVIFDMHEYAYNSLLSRPWIPAYLRTVCSRILRMSERIFLGHMSVVGVVDSMAKDYPWVGDLTIVRNLPILDEISQIKEPQAAEFTIAYVGTVCPERGSAALVKAAGLCQQRGIKLHIDFVGAVDHEHRRELEDLIRSFGLENVRLHGRLLPEEAWRVAARCHLGIALTNPTPNLINSLPTKALEYMALGKPVLASRIPLLRTIVEANGAGLCVDPNNVDEIADAIENVVHNPERWQEAGRHGKEAVTREWSWEEESKKLLKLYRDLLAITAYHRRDKEARFLIYSLGPDEAHRTLELPEGITVNVWRPTRTAMIPPSCGRLSSLAYWLLHQLQMFTNRDYQVLYLMQRGRMIHRLSLIPRCQRWPFIEPSDLQISNTWTPSELRGRRLASVGLNAALASAWQPDRWFWYVTREDNLASIQVCTRAGFKLTGYARRTSPLGLHALGKFKVEPLVDGKVCES